MEKILEQTRKIRLFLNNLTEDHYADTWHDIMACCDIIDLNVRKNTDKKKTWWRFWK